MTANRLKLLCVLALTLPWTTGAVAADPAPVPGQTPAAKTEAEMKPYTEQIKALDLKFDFVPVPAGKFLMGSPAKEKQHLKDEGPQVEVNVKAFWIMTCEVNWKQFKAFMDQYERFPEVEQITPPLDGAKADAVSFPTPLYDASYAFRKGVHHNLPAVSMTPFAARHFTKWLSLKTGRFYRLPTEAEWEYACRAGGKGAYHFGDDAKKLGEHAWFLDNSTDARLDEHVPRAVGSKKPNAWGLYDMHGNVAELVIDQFHADHYAKLKAAKNVDVLKSIAWPKEEYPRVVRGGSFENKAADLRCARRMRTQEKYKEQDPQIPQSIWWFTDAHHIGFRIVRPLTAPTGEQQQRWWDSAVEEVNEVLESQRSGDA